MASQHSYGDKQAGQGCSKPKVGPVNSRPGNRSTPSCPFRSYQPGTELYWDDWKTDTTSMMFARCDLQSSLEIQCRQKLGLWGKEAGRGLQTTIEPLRIAECGNPPCKLQWTTAGPQMAPRCARSHPQPFTVDLEAHCVRKSLQCAPFGVLKHE